MSRLLSGSFNVILKDGREDQRELLLSTSSCSTWDSFWSEVKKHAPHISPSTHELKTYSLDTLTEGTYELSRVIPSCRVWPIGFSASSFRETVEFPVDPHAVTSSNLYRVSSIEGGKHPGPSAVGEFVDNAIESLSIRWKEEAREKRSRPLTIEIIFVQGASGLEEIAIWDNGTGIGATKDKFAEWAKYKIPKSQRLGVRPEGISEDFDPGRLSFYGAGAKNGGFFLANRVEVISKHKMNPMIGHLALDKGEIHGKNDVGERWDQGELHWTFLPEEGSGPELHESIGVSFGLWRYLSDHALKEPSFCLSRLSQLNGGKNGVGRPLADVDALAEDYMGQLSQIYYYYLHPKELKSLLPNLHIPPVSINFVRVKSNGSVMSTDSLADADCFEKRLMERSRGKPFVHRFSGEQLIAVLRYYPVQHGRSTMPLTRQEMNRLESSMDDEEERSAGSDEWRERGVLLDGIDESEMTSFAFECFWNGRQCPETECPLTAVFEIPARVFPRGTVSRLRGQLFFGSKYAITEEKLRLVDSPEEALLGERSTRERLNANRKAVKKMFREWLKRVHADFDHDFQCSGRMESEKIGKEKYTFYNECKLSGMKSTQRTLSAGAILDTKKSKTSCLRIHKFAVAGDTGDELDTSNVFFCVTGFPESIYNHGAETFVMKKHTDIGENIELLSKAKSQKLLQLVQQFEPKECKMKIYDKATKKYVFPSGPITIHAGEDICFLPVVTDVRGRPWSVESLSKSFSPFPGVPFAQRMLEMECVIRTEDPDDRPQTIPRMPMRDDEAGGARLFIRRAGKNKVLFRVFCNQSKEPSFEESLFVTVFPTKPDRLELSLLDDPPEGIRLGDPIGLAFVAYDANGNTCPGTSAKEMCAGKPSLSSDDPFRIIGHHVSFSVSKFKFICKDSLQIIPRKNAMPGKPRCVFPTSDSLATARLSIKFSGGSENSVKFPVRPGRPKELRVTRKSSAVLMEGDNLEDVHVSLYDEFGFPTVGEPLTIEFSGAASGSYLRRSNWHELEIPGGKIKVAAHSDRDAMDEEKGSDERIVHVGYADLHASFKISIASDTLPSSVQLLDEEHGALPLDVKKRGQINGKVRVPPGGRLDRIRLLMIDKHSQPAILPHGKTGTLFINDVAFQEDITDEIPQFTLSQIFEMPTAPVEVSHRPLERMFRFQFGSKNIRVKLSVEVVPGPLASLDILFKTSGPSRSAAQTSCGELLPDIVVVFKDEHGNRTRDSADEDARLEFMEAIDPSLHDPSTVSEEGKWVALSTSDAIIREQTAGYTTITRIAHLLPLGHFDIRYTVLQKSISSNTLRVDVGLGEPKRIKAVFLEASQLELHGLGSLPQLGITCEDGAGNKLPWTSSGLNKGVILFSSKKAVFFNPQSIPVEQCLKSTKDNGTMLVIESIALATLTEGHVTITVEFKNAKKKLILRDACAASIAPCIRPIAIEYKLLGEFEGGAPFPDILVRPVLERGSLAVSEEDRVAYLNDCEIHVSTTDCVYAVSPSETDAVTAHQTWKRFVPRDPTITVSNRAIILKIDLIDQREGWDVLKWHLPPLEERLSVKHPEASQPVSTEERSQRRLAQRLQSIQDDFLRLISKFGDKYRPENLMKNIERLEQSQMRRLILEARDMYSARKAQIIEAFPRQNSRFPYISELAFVQKRHGMEDHHMNRILSTFLGRRLSFLVVNTIDEQDAVYKSDADFICKELFVRSQPRPLPPVVLAIKGATPAMDYLYIPDQSNIPIFNRFLGNMLVVETFDTAKYIQRMPEARDVSMLCLDCHRIVSSDGMARKMRPPPKDRRIFSFGNVAQFECRAMRKDIDLMERILEEARRVVPGSEASAGMRHMRDGDDRDGRDADDQRYHGARPPKVRKR